MSDINEQTRAIFRSILRDIQVELGDEFDQNFERQAFFSHAWQGEQHSVLLRASCGGHP